jgi:hypothetical protein
MARTRRKPRNRGAMTMEGPSKAKLLAHYTDKDPRAFHQFDGWRHGDAVVGCDENGHGATAGKTWELMQGSNVRVLIPLDTPAADAVILLRKITSWIECGALREIEEMSLDDREMSLDDTPF